MEKDQQIGILARHTLSYDRRDLIVRIYPHYLFLCPYSTEKVRTYTCVYCFLLVVGLILSR